MRSLILLPLILVACKSSASASYADGDAGPVKAEGHVARTAAAPARAAEPATDRLLVRTGALTLRTGNADEVGSQAEAAVKKAGGWLVSRRNLHFVFRIPAKRFEEVFVQVEGLGSVVSRSLDVQDVTEAVHDLELRLRNARALRDRYQQLLAKAEKVPDVLAIERELTKVTEEIERLEAQLKNKRRDVGYSLLTLDLTPVGPGQGTASRSPFQWVGRIGIERLPHYRPDRAYRSRVRWKLPADFADMGRTDERDLQGWAYSPDGVRIVVRRFDNKPEVNRAFWEKEVLRELVRARGYRQEKTDNDVLRFRTAAGGQPTSYALRLVVTDRYITLVEVIGPTDVLAKQWPRVARVIRSVEATAR